MIDWMQKNYNFIAYIVVPIVVALIGLNYGEKNEGCVKIKV